MIQSTGLWVLCFSFTVVVVTLAKFLYDWASECRASRKLDAAAEALRGFMKGIRLFKRLKIRLSKPITQTVTLYCFTIPRHDIERNTLETAP